MSHGLFSLLTERLMLHSSQFTMTTYNVLFEVGPCFLAFQPQSSTYRTEEVLIV